MRAVPRYIHNIKMELRICVPMFYVDLNPIHNNKTIYELKHINQAVVKVEPPAKTVDVVQCQRCKEFGDIMPNCRKPFRCVKCAMDHSTTECNKSQDTPPKCVHCLTNHTSNYICCKVYQNLVKSRHHRQKQNLQHFNKLYA